jgi:hypothetical protein
MIDQLPPQDLSCWRFWNGTDKSYSSYFLVWCNLQEEMISLELDILQKTELLLV